MIQLRIVGLTVAALTAFGAAAARRRAPDCDAGNGGIDLPNGFCATVFADSLPLPRHMYVMSDGDVLVSLLGSRRAGAAGGIVLLRDADHDGHAESKTDFVRGFSSSEVAVFDKHLYAEFGSGVLRYPLKEGQMPPAGPADTIVSGLPPGGNHPFKTFAIGRDGSLYVNVGSSDNVCDQGAADATHPPDPCTELQSRAGIWRFDARRKGQHQSDGIHYARGYRNGVGLAIGPDGRLWGMQHGRDALFQNWPSLFDAKYGAENPAEEMFQVKRGDDMGWPYCFYSNVEKKIVDAPEYGGDGKKDDRCRTKKEPVAAYPGHWAPNGLVFYTGSMFPAKYKNGVFIAFHGSWNRLPEPQAGYRVVFQPMKGDKTAGEYETFADKFSPNSGGTGPNRRPAGVAVGPDGALYIADDATGRIWKVVYAKRS